MSALFSALSLCIMLSGPVTPPADRVSISHDQFLALRKNIVANLDHRIPEIRGNTMQLLIDLRQSMPSLDLGFAVIPVMRILKQDTAEAQRILAAVTLYHLNTQTGRYAVERRALYDDSERVARHCSRIAHFWDGERDFPWIIADTGQNRLKRNKSGG